MKLCGWNGEQPKEVQYADHTVLAFNTDICNTRLCQEKRRKKKIKPKHFSMIWSPPETQNTERA